MRKKRETSKVILLASWAVTLTLTALVVVCTFVTCDPGNIVTLAALAWGELTASHAFYLWKAKNENRAKGSQRLIKELAAKYGIEAAARFAELIYKD